ncbi:hypothetical protein [Guyparkeria sp.]|uniref:hypothetical protein n=1 Tax=Guyparkeria sp. TaxID=2035736 RepID=UPI003970A469
MTRVSSQIAAAHIDLIRAIAGAVGEQVDPSEARAAIERYREDGWSALADALEQRLAGQPVDASSLDDEDRVVLDAVENAASNPAWLDAVEAEAEAEAAEQIAALILAATWGEREALAAINEMRETAESAGVAGSTAHAFVAIVEGERDIDCLSRDFPESRRGLVNATLAAVRRQERA